MTTLSNSPVFVSGEVVRQVFTWSEAIESLRATYRLPPQAGTSPPRTVATVGKAWLRTLPAFPPTGRYFGAKLMGAGVQGVSAGVEYVIVLFDRETSRIAAFLDANAITAFRTAATSALALDGLARATPARLAVLGSGLEASNHVRAFAAVRKLTEVVVHSPTPERRTAFAEALTRDLGVPARAVASGEAAVDGADIVLAAARSQGEKPILFGNWLQRHATVVSIGSTIPQQREIDASVVERSDLIICDSLEEVLTETGDMIAAEAAGIKFHAKSFSLNDLVSGSCEDRVRAADIRMFKSVGGGLQDIVVAELLVRKALEAGLATSLPIQFESKR
ncbi:ornithine cyclodeaminase family protein [Hydrogenophaga sp.]|uniref:ornithine cyclodeaminase family protein n=1 Tax=Hydrogenophaga sp. TaxID=1904254 RepID=UPI00271F512A|nr:ornithine cyclodeaminase family protein [Hydrogenophaga sp.]MDO8905618.1 ornithine cyclodeaminase family protein [Hydrogenophaga sp.]